SNRRRLSSYIQEPERASNQRPGLRATRPMHTCALTDAAEQGIKRAESRLIPYGSSEAPGSPALLPLAMQKFVHIKHRVALEHVIDRPREFMREESQGFALAMLVFQAGQVLLSCRIVAEEQHGRFRKGPLEVRVADFLARSAIAFARRFPGALDQ